MESCVRLSARRTGSTREGYGVYAFAATPTAEGPEAATPWRCDTCRWWEVIPELAHDPSGRHGCCILAEQQDPPEATGEASDPLNPCLADDGLATAADFGCLGWQTAVVPASAPWLAGAGDDGWRFPGVATAFRPQADFPDGSSSPAGTVFSFRAPEGNGSPPAPDWSCRSCRWHGTSTAYRRQRRGGFCTIAEKGDLWPEDGEPEVFLKAYTGEDPWETAATFGCAMWNDACYEGMPERRLG